jgi:SAM-dependent methyltransferase
MLVKTMPPQAIFERDLMKFKGLGGRVDELKPILTDFDFNYCVDGQYLFMGSWAFDRIREQYPQSHVDVGGQIQFLTFLSKFVPVEHVDIRSCNLNFSRIKYVQGTITNLPHESGSVRSISCLHVAEHIGLGRYGDIVDPNGFIDGCRELARVLAPGGRLYFAVPTGIPRVVFNAHRVLSSGQVLEAFPGLKLVEFSGIDSHGTYAEKQPVNSLDTDPYGCGLYIFKKEN